MATSTSPDIPLLISSEAASSERRISPSWTISQLKGRLEPITGVPSSCQRLVLKVGSSTAQAIEAANEDSVQLSQFSLQAYAEIVVTDTRPAGLRTNLTDVSAVSKYEMSQADYESRNDSVLAYKKSHQIGRFDPQAPTLQQQKLNASYREVDERHIKVNSRCRLLPDSDHRRGTVRFVGEVEEIPGVGVWVGVELDEPTGKNDGSVKGVRYFECKAGFGVFVKPERVEVGDFSMLDELGDEDEEF